MEMKDELVEALKELEEATAIYDSLRQVTQSARTAETGALNRVNSAQKVVDSMVQKWKVAANSDTDWGKERTKP
jgi:hypothetical protein